MQVNTRRSTVQWLGALCAVVCQAGTAQALPRDWFRDVRQPPLAPASTLWGAVPAAAPTVSKTRGAFDLVALYRKVAPATVIIRTPTGMGTGVIISADGLVLTNHHVVEDGQREGLMVGVDLEIGRLGDKGLMERAKSAQRAHVIKWDKAHDLALLRIDGKPSGLPYVAVEGRDATPGENVAVVGHGSVGLLWSVRGCQVSGVGRMYEMASAMGFETSAGGGKPGASDGLREYLKKERPGVVMQTSCIVSPGDSGGPVVSERGDIVGLNSFMRADKEHGVAGSYHVSGADIRQFLSGAPRDPQPMLPDPWAFGWRRTVETQDDGVVVLTARSFSGNVAFFRLRAPQPVKETADQFFENRSFLADVVMSASDDDLVLWLAANAAGQLDHVVHASNRTGKVHSLWRSSASGLQALTDKRIKNVFDAFALLPNDGASVMRRQLAEVGEGWLSGATIGGGGVPDPYVGTVLTCSLEDKNGDGKSDVLNCLTDRGRILYFDPARGISQPPPAGASVETLRGKVPLAVIQQEGVTWALHDMPGGGAVDLALSSGTDSESFTKAAFVIERGGARAAPEYLGQALVRPKLLGLSATLTGQLENAWAASGTSKVIERKGALGTFPSWPAGAWASGVRKSGGVFTVFVVRTLFGADVMGIDVSGKVEAMKDKQFEQAVAKGRLPYQLGVLSLDGSAWIFQDCDGDGSTDRVVFVLDQGSATGTVAFAVNKSGAALLDKTYSPKGMFSTEAYTNPEILSSLNMALEAMSLREGDEGQ